MGDDWTKPAANRTRFTLCQCTLKEKKENSRAKTTVSEPTPVSGKNEERAPMKRLTKEDVVIQNYTEKTTATLSFSDSSFPI